MTIGWRNKNKSSLYWSQVLLLWGRGSLITKISVRVALFKNISLDIPCLVFSTELLIIGLSTFWNISHLQPLLPHKYVQCILPAHKLTAFRQNILNIMWWFDTFKPTKIYHQINPIFIAKSNHALALSQKLLSRHVLQNFCRVARRRSVLVLQQSAALHADTVHCTTAMTRKSSIMHVEWGWNHITFFVSDNHRSVDRYQYYI